MIKIPSATRNIFHNLLNYFGLLMVFVYLAAGITLLFPIFQISFLNNTSRLVLGIALIFYGIFRAWRIFKTRKNEEEPD
jgi:hypothetical protein